MRQIYINGYFKGFNKLNTYSLLKEHPQAEVIEKRLKIISFFDRFGYEATEEAFNVSRSTVYLWKKHLKEAKGRITALAPKSKAPHHKRQRKVSPSIINFIKDYRTLHPGVGKETIKPCLDLYCQSQGLATISESTIGRIINDLKKRCLIPDLSSRLNYYARSDRFHKRPFKPKRKKLRRKGYQPKKPGDLVQMDSIVIFQNEVKRYILTAVDLKTRVAFAYLYENHSSKTAVDFVKKLKKVAPFSIKRIQTDNGSEFEKDFRAYAEKEGLVHFHNYPRRPQSNPFIERFNRTIQEQHVRWHKDDLYVTEIFNKGLMDYLLWYNTEKPHRRLNKEPPLKYYVDNFLSKENSNMLWTPSVI
jgi:putative transposase